jgi:hypothetical protein
MAAKKPGIPDLGIDIKKKKKKGDSGQDINATLLRKQKRQAQANTGRSKAMKAYHAQKNNVVPVVAPVVVPAVKVSRFDKFVSKVAGMDDIKKLKKMIYDRNYKINKKYKKEFPEKAADRENLKFPPVVDVRIVGQAAFNRLKKIKDQDKLITELRKIIIDTTRRKNNPKVTADYSNREQDYLANGLSSLKEAFMSWGDDALAKKLEPLMSTVNLDDIHNIFKAAPSFWAISSGFYYAIADFDNFMNEIYSIVRRVGVSLSVREQAELRDRLFRNDPRTFRDFTK